MAKLSKDEWIALFNKFINESDSYGEAIEKVQQYIADNYSFSIGTIVIYSLIEVGVSAYYNKKI